MISTAPNSNLLQDAIRSGTLTTAQVNRMVTGDAWRLTPATFAHHVSKGEWIAAKHLLKASAEIAQAVYQGGARILAEWPPRHGKSELLSVYTPMWFLDLFPKKKVAMASYGADLIEDFSVRVRDNILAEEETGLLNVKIKEDRQRVDNFHTTMGGALRAVGIGGPLTGRGADLLLIDDYLKNAKDAASKVIRDDIYNWFLAVAFTRLEPGASIVIFAARWDVDDLAGRLMRDAPGVWKVIRFPAICDSTDDVLGRQVGEALWPSRFNEDYLTKIVQPTLGKFFWSALYQQRPLRKVEGLTRDKFQIVTGLPHKSRMRWVRSWDFAATEDGGDWTVGTLIGEDIINGLIYIADVIRGQWSPNQVEEQVKTAAKNDNERFFTEIDIEQEPGSAGKTVIAQYKKILNKYAVHAMSAVNQGSKILRANGLVAAVEAEAVHLLQNDKWNKTFIDEMEMHPDCDPDDQRDSAAQGFNRLMELSGHSATWGRTDLDRQHTPDGANDNAYHTGAVFGNRNR